MKGNGSSILQSDRDEENKLFKMELFMKDGGKIIKQMAKVGLFTLMEISMKVTT